MNSLEIIAACSLIIALLSLLITFHINKSIFSKEVKYIFIAAIFIIGLIFIYTLSLNLFNNSSESAINISAIDRTYVVPNLSSIVSFFTPPIFTSISLDYMNNLSGWKIQPREGANGTIHLVESPYKAIKVDYNLGANTAFVMSKRKGFSIFGENINKVN